MPSLCAWRGPAEAPTPPRLHYNQRGNPRAMALAVDVDQLFSLNMRHGAEATWVTSASGKGVIAHAGARGVRAS